MMQQEARTPHPDLANLKIKDLVLMPNGNKNQAKYVMEHHKNYSHQRSEPINHGLVLPLIQPN